MAIKEVLMPHLGESVTEATVVQWLVQPGEKVKRYSPLMEVVSDKVTTEVPSDFDGVVQSHLVELDVSLPIGTALMTLEVTEEEGDGQSSEASESTVRDDQTVVDTAQEVAESPNESVVKGENASRYSPAVLKIAGERGLDLNQVKGSGKGGRITRKDVMTFEPSDMVSETTAKEEQMAPEVIKEVKVATQELVQPAKESATQPVGEMVPADAVRKAIAKKMVQSVNEIPHAWMMVEADVTNIVSLRNKLKGEFKKQEGMNLSFFPFFAKAVTQALKKNPKINTSWQDGNIIYHKDTNLSIAITTNEHLFVPVIQQADNYSLAGLAKEINRLADSARKGSLGNQEMQGGTFTLNNTGSLGSVQSMGIINHPQAAILQVESIVKRMVPTADGGFKAADMVNLCLSIDHRILDGQQAGQFLKDVKVNLARYSDETDIY